MDRPASFAALTAVVLLFCTSCQLLFDFERVDFVPEPGPGCTLPSKGSAGVRLAQLVTDTERFDLCVRPEGGSFAKIRPVLDAAGRDCPTGLAYKDVTTRIGLEAGTYSFHVVTGDGSCTDAPVAAATATLDAGQIVTLALVGPSAEAASLEALPETPSTANSTLVRFVHAVVDHDDGELEAGIAPSASDPTALTLAFRDVPFGGTAPVSPGLTSAVDAAGYTDIGGNFDVEALFAMRPSGGSAPLAVELADLKSGTSFTIYGVGNGDDYPHEVWICPDKRDSSTPLTDCGQPVSVSVETFATQLSDHFMRDVDQRAGSVVELVEDLDADLVCLSEVYVTEYLDAIEAAAEDRYLVVRSDDPEITITGDLTTREGDLPPPIPIPCEGDAAAAAHALLACVAERCSGDGVTLGGPGDRATSCLTDEEGCLAQVIPFLVGNALGEGGKQCWGCLIPALSERRTLADTEALCTTESEERWVFGRSAGVVVLARRGTFSALDDADPELHRLPSFAWQKGALRCPLRLTENGAEFDFYCTHLTYQRDVANPYVGPYGEGATGPDGAEAEQMLQAERLLRLVTDQAGSSGRRAILAGELYASPDANETTVPDLLAFRPETLATLTSQLQPLVAPAFVPTCTWCDNNPLNCQDCGDGSGSPTRGHWFAHLLGFGFYSSSVLSTSVTHQELVTAGIDAAGPIPASMSYGLRSTLSVTQ